MTDADKVSRASSFETRPAGAPQDEGLAAPRADQARKIASAKPKRPA